MHTFLTRCFLALLCGLPSFAMAQDVGYFISTTPLTVSYIVCSGNTPPDACHETKENMNSAKLGPNQQALSISFNQDSLVKIIRVTIGQQTYNYSNDALCIMTKNTAIKFEQYNVGILCAMQPFATSQ